MAKATLVLPDGATVALESSDEGIAKILSIYGASISQPITETGTKRKSRKKKTGKGGAKRVRATGLKSRLEDLIADGFFKTKKLAREARDALVTKGFSHSPQTVSTELIRLVRSGKLDREKKGRVWVYFSK